MKTLIPILFVLVAIAFYSCGGSGSSTAGSTTDQTTASADQKPAPSMKGVGEIKHVDIGDPLDDQMIKGGKMIYDMKCSACHKLTDQRVVGPGWAGVTNRRTPEWIMNMVTDTDMMLASDPQAQALLEQCLVRMPNQHLSLGDARNVLEFMRKNDMDRTGKKDQAKAG